MEITDTFCWTVLSTLSPMKTCVLWKHLKIITVFFNVSPNKMALEFCVFWTPVLKQLLEVTHHRDWVGETSQERTAEITGAQAGLRLTEETKWEPNPVMPKPSRRSSPPAGQPAPAWPRTPSVTTPAWKRKLPSCTQQPNLRGTQSPTQSFLAWLLFPPTAIKSWLPGSLSCTLLMDLLTVISNRSISNLLYKR